jgi:hypothetical protein
MQHKTILFAKNENLFSLKKANQYYPIYAYPGFNFSSKIAGYYERHGLSILGKAIDMDREIHLNTCGGILGFLANKELLHFIFLSGSYRQSNALPLGYNCLQVQDYFGNNIIHILQIGNLYKETDKGIGRASVALAAMLYFNYFAEPRDNFPVLGITPLDRDKENLYLSYGFVKDEHGRLQMSASRAWQFIRDYRKVLKTALILG